MLIVQKMYIKEFLKALAVVGLGISLVFSIIGLIDKIDEFMPHKPALRLLLEYTVLTIPKYFHYLMAMSTLLTSLLIFSMAINRKEIVIIKAASGRMKRILLPFLGIGLALTLLGFGLEEIVIPATSKRIRSIRNQITEKKKEVTYKDGTLYMRGKDGSIVRISFFLPDQNISKDVSIFSFDGGALKERIDAATAEWAGSAWKLKNVTVYDMSNGKVINRSEMPYPNIESPKIFKEDLWAPEEMNIIELINYQHRLAEAGFKNIKLIVDISSRLSYPLINFFMLLLGISLAVGGEHKALQKILHRKAASSHSGAIAAGLGLLISLIYWLGYSVFLSLGYTGAIHPAVAPWVMPLAFAGISVYLYSQIPE
ncbi:MAG: LptF/LptG family permease [Nitrospirae bacterium]|nr:LptF/LptG family permease [Nitrospirota bacterium]